MTVRSMTSKGREVEVAVLDQTTIPYALVIEMSKPGAAHPRYKAGLALPICSHQHRSLQAAGHCAVRTAGDFAKRVLEARDEREGA